MKVLFIGMTKKHGGTETYILNTARLLWEKTDAELFFLDIEEHGIVYQQYIRDHGGTIIPYTIHRGLPGLAYNRGEADRFFQQHHFDVVDVNVNILRNGFWTFAAKRSGVKKIFVHSHNSSYGQRSKTKQFVYNITDGIDRQKLRRANVQLLAASEGAGKWMFHDLPFQVIHNGIDTTRFRFSATDREAIRRQLKISDASLVLISVARFVFQKNQEQAVTIFNQLLKERPDAYLLFVGDGERLNSVKQMVHERGIQDRVRFLGYRDDIPQLLSAADIMLFPSRYEGTPYSLMEAESSGLGVVASSEAFRPDEDLTGLVNFCSLADADEQWSQTIGTLFDRIQASARDELRLTANAAVEHSRYSLVTFEQQIMNLYFPTDDGVNKK